MALYFGSEKVIINNYKPISEIVAINTTTNEEYDDLQEALNVAAANETIKLLKDVNVYTLHICKNTTFDLNGYVLYASYMACYGDIIDSSANNTGLLNIFKENFLIQKNNAQLPIKSDGGYRFFEVIKFNKLIRPELFQFVFQPFIDTNALEILKQGSEVSGLQVGMRILRNESVCDFFNDEASVLDFFNSYNESTNKYSIMLMYQSNEALPEGKYSVLLLSETGVEILSDEVEYTQ